MFGIRNRVTDDAFEESLEDAAGFFVDHWWKGASANGSKRHPYPLLPFSPGKGGKGGGGVEGTGGEWEGKGGHTGRDTLDTATTGETTDGGLGDALDVVAEDFAVAFGAAFAEAFASFSAWRGKVSKVCVSVDDRVEGVGGGVVVAG